jgi:hypothetical protein
MTQQLNSSPKIEITATTSPAPPWAGEKFACEKCKGEFQLEAADPCELRLILNDHLESYNTPPCPTKGCGHINVITIDKNEKAKHGNS